MKEPPIEGRLSMLSMPVTARHDACQYGCISSIKLHLTLAPFPILQARRVLQPLAPYVP